MTNLTFLFCTPLRKFVAILIVMAFTLQLSSLHISGQTFFEVELEVDVFNGTSGAFFDLPGEGYTAIHGFNDIAGEEDGIDVYKIVITESSNFYVRHEGIHTTDTKAFLFDSNFNAVMTNDDDPAQILGISEHFGFRDATTHLGGTIGNPPAALKDDEIYFLAIGVSGDVARNSMGNDLFLSDGGDRDALVGPIEPAESLDAWTSNGGGPYQITLSGARVVGYSIPDNATSRFTWTGNAGNGSMADINNWMEASVPTSGFRTDILFNDLDISNSVEHDLSDLLVRSIDVDCNLFDFTLTNDGLSSICTESYGRICVRGGLPNRCFRISAPLEMENEAVLVADDGEFLIDGSNGQNGSVTGMGTVVGNGLIGAIFQGPNGRVTFDSVGSSVGSTLMGNFNTSIELTVTFCGDNFFDPPMIGTLPNLINGPTVFDSSGGASINGGRFRFLDTVILVLGGDVFTLNPDLDSRFTTSLIFITAGTELRCEGDNALGGQAEFAVSPGATLRNCGVEIGPSVVVEPLGRVAGTGLFRKGIIAHGLIAPGDIADFDIGTLDVNGDIDMSRTTITCIELGGTSSMDHDQLNSGKNADPMQTFDLAGQLAVTLVDDFIPSNADEFFIINCNNLTGTFSECNVQPFGSFDIEYGTAPGNSFVRLFNFDSGMSNPDSFVLEAGTLAGGTIADIETSDDSYLEIDAGRVPVAGSLVSAVFDSSLTDTDPENLSVVLEANANTAGLNQQIEAFNWISGEYELIDVSSASAFVDSTTTVDIGDSISSYVDNDGSVRIRIRWFEVGPVLRFPWRVSIDQILWDTN